MSKNNILRKLLCVIVLLVNIGIVLGGVNVNASASVSISYDSGTSSEGYQPLASNSLTQIMGKGTLGRGSMIVKLASRNTNLTSSQMENFVDLTIQEANNEGVKYDVAFSLMMLETNFLQFGGDVKSDQNNFGGLGATGNGARGESFSSVQIGIRAVIQHLKAYASDIDLVGTCVDNRFKYVTRNSAVYVEYLGIQENPNGYGWASAENYGDRILNVYKLISEQAISSSKILTKSAVDEALFGNSINISVTTTQSSDTLYRVWVRDNGVWKIISDYSTNNSVSYTPQNVGDLVIQVDVKYKYSNNEYDDAWSKFIKIQPSTKLVDPKVTGEMKAGKPVTISASASPAADALYRIWVRDNGVWKLISDYSTTNSVNYTPQYIGIFVVQIDVKNKYSTTSTYNDAWSKLYTISGNTSKLQTKSVTGEMKAGKPVTISASANPAADSLYRIWVRDNGLWKLISDYSKTDSVNYIPEYIGTFVVQIDVKSKYSTTNTYDDAWSQLYTVSGSKSKIQTKSVTGEMKVGKSVTISATATPSVDSLYRIWVRDNGVWKLISDYSTTNSVNYTPQYGGTFVVQIDVKSKYSTTSTYDDAWSELYNINMNISKIQTKSVTGEMKAGKPVTISASASPAADSLYRIWIRDNGVWKLISDYSTTKSVNYTPQYVGIFVVQIDVKSKYSITSTYDDAWSQLYNISGDISKIQTKSVTGEMKVGKPVTISASTSPAADSLYRIWVRDNGVWKLISDYSTTKSVNYTPQYVGIFVVQIDVKSKYSITSTYDDAWSQLYNISGDISKIQTKSVTGEMKAGKSVTISATATPSVDSLYRIWVRDNGVWKLISDYSTTNSVKYTPQYGGTFVVQIDVKSKYSTTSTYDDAWSELYTMTYDKSSIVSVDVSGYINSGRIMDINVASNNDSNTLFRIWIRENNVWKIISDFSEKSSVSYMPVCKGPYVYQVEVKSKQSSQTYDDAKSSYLYSSAKDMTIVIDAGHGLDAGKFDCGAVGTLGGVQYKESELNLKVALKLYDQLKSRGYNVLMIRRTENTGYNFKDRPMFANNSYADLYISIHHNAAGTGAVGTEVLYQDSDEGIDKSILNSVLAAGLPDPRIDNATRISKSKKLAKILADNISSSIVLNNRGSKEQDLYVCRNTVMPAVLIECGFLTNEGELKKLIDEGTQLTTARAIAISVDEYFGE